MDEGKVVSCKPVVARRHPTALLDFVEEPFDEVASSIEVRAKADRIAAFDRQEARHAVLLNRVPNTVVIALYGLAIVASAFAGYAAGLDAQRSRLPIYTIGVLVSIVIFLIQDLDRPGPGLITVSQQPMLDTAASIAAFAD